MELMTLPDAYNNYAFNNQPDECTPIEGKKPLTRDEINKIFEDALKEMSKTAAIPVKK